MPSFSAPGPLRRLVALALTLGPLSLPACAGAEADEGCQDCGPSCANPTACTNRGVEIEVRAFFSSDAAPPTAPLRIVVSFEQYAVAYSFDSAQSASGGVPSGPCTSAANGAAAPELCRVSPAGSLHVVARSDMLRDYDQQEYVVGVSIEDGDGKLMFSDSRKVALDPVWAPGCRPAVDPAYCGQGHVVLTR